MAGVCLVFVFSSMCRDLLRLIVRVECGMAVVCLCHYVLVVVFGVNCVDIVCCFVGGGRVMGFIFMMGCY